jgi:hypothetical protein
MRTLVRLRAFAALTGLLSACGPVPNPQAGEVDLCPPLVQAVESTAADRIDIEFDEEATLRADKTRISPSLTVATDGGSSRQVCLVGQAQTPGLLYTLEAEAEDARGNSASFIAQFYGFNGNVPRLLINEVTPRGSGNHPDIAELRVMTDGDMGGVVLYIGTPDNFDARLVFPSFAVKNGQFILVHLKPAGIPAEVDETSSLKASGGFDASDTAYDFWLPDGRGISGTNGVLSLYERPGGACLDGLLYSNRTSQSDERYRGFGSADMLARAERLVKDGGWKAAGPRVAPEDAVSPEGSTGTRSLCRSSQSIDTDGPEDWHVVPTRKATFGAANSDEVMEGLHNAAGS